ncbi:seminase-like [Musca vetustissima]|uniref:seminase-like n=1 Tax=Musca vetustissima TaxID=27455 RepID=UPI002AB5FD7F|nr:seminase-like [Musca vetustissima]
MKPTSVTFVFLLLVVLNETCANAVSKLRIIGGKKTTINQTKYIVSLRLKNGEFFCGGTLVAKRYVVTAAHCMEGLTARDFNVHGGVTYLNQIGVRRSVQKISIPKSFNMKNVNMDVAVLKLDKPMTGRYIAPIRLCSHRIRTNDWVKVSGWGLTHENGTRPSNQLRTVNVRMISKQKCKRDYRSVMQLSRTMMCGSVPGKKDACSGDSGGPLVHRGELCGIVSFGIGCGRKNFPGVYTTVNHVKRFIRQSMK